MLDPNSSEPPPPDVRCPVDGVSLYFELGEVLQEDIAWASARQTRQRIKNGQRPLLSLWHPLESMLTKKLNKIYNPEARPLSLLLYYATIPSFWDLQQATIASQAAKIQAALNSSGFDQVSLFDATRCELLFQFDRYSAPSIEDFPDHDRSPSEKNGIL